MGRVINNIKGLFGEVRIIFQEYDPPSLEYPPKVEKNPQKRGWIHGSDVMQFATVTSGAAWHKPSSPNMSTLFDQIAANKSLTIHARIEGLFRRLSEAEKSKTVLGWVELFIVEKKGVELSDTKIKQPPLIGYDGTGRTIETVRLNGCRVSKVIAINKTLFTATFKAASAEPRKRGGGGGCPPFACGSG